MARYFEFKTLGPCNDARHANPASDVSLDDHVFSAFAYLGLSADQESSVLSLIHVKTDELIRLYDFSEDMQATFAALLSKLKDIQ